MNKRYQKVLGLYALSTLVPTLLHRKSNRKNYTQWMTKTAMGYGIFAVGLKQMTKRKQRQSTN